MHLVNSIEEADLVVHSGIFHADDVLCAAMLQCCSYDELLVMRIENWPKDIDPDSHDFRAIVADIGKGKYDHHQDVRETRDNGVPYASAGKLWRDYGKSVVRNHYYHDWLVAMDYDVEPETELPEDRWIVEAAAASVDRTFIQGIDAVDNGKYPKVDYPCNSFSVSSLITSMNPHFDSEKNLDECFEEAVEMMMDILGIVVDEAISTAKARSYVEMAILNSTESHPRIMVLEKNMQRKAWQIPLFKSEDPTIQQISKDMLYCVFPSIRNPGAWNWHVVPKSLGAFDQRCTVPREWLGKEYEELAKVTGVKSSIFCHKDGFIGAAKTKEGAILMAQKAIALSGAWSD